MNTDDKEKALQDFLLDIDCLDALLPWTGKFNLFDVLKISRTEIRHSNVLACLFSANENHGMGDAFIRGILQKLVENDTEGRYDVFGVLLMDFYSFTIYREWKNIDILLVSDEEKTVIAIENKVGSGEHSDQLNRYRKILEETYPDYQRVLAFLTPDGDAPSDEKNWGILTYLDIIDVLEDICSRMDLVPDVGLMIKNYVETLRRDVVDDQQLKEVCNKIYEKHKKALDLIFENRIDSKSQTAAAIRSVLLEYTENGKIIYDGSDNSDSYIKFYTKEMDELLKPMMENNSSWGNDRVYCFWMGSRDEAFRTVFELGGWNVPPELDAIQQKIIDIEKPNDKKRKDFRYKRVYSKKFTIDEADESLRSKMAAALDDMLMWQKRLIREITAEKE